MKDRDEGTGTREQEPGTREQEPGTRDKGLGTGEMEHLLRNALKAVGEQAEPDRDLWPAMLRRFDEESKTRVSRIPWFDWALAGGLVAFVAMAPHTVPVILYYL
jgi:hypothetical protein